MKAMLTDQEHKMVWSDVDEPQVKADSVLIEKPDRTSASSC